MKLSNNDKEKIRKKLELELSEVSDGVKIKFDKDFLENLIFDKGKTKFTGIDAKVIVWSGSFLRKLDLSEISFDDVIWSSSDIDFWRGLEDFLLLPKQRYINNPIDLSYTNASIDFSKSFEVNYRENVNPNVILKLENCNLEGIDLSDSHMELIQSINNSNSNILNTDNKFYLDKDSLRKKIEFKTLNLPDGELLKVDKDILEELLFDKTKTIFTGVPAKIIAWSGPFLSKIDLSEVSFDNVIWSSSSPSFWKGAGQVVLAPQNKYESFVIDLSGTNACIDFAKSFETLYERETNEPLEIELFNCNLEGVDLRNSNFSLIHNARNTNIAFTSAEVDINSKVLNFINCNLQGINLSGLKVNSVSINPYWETLLDFSGCNLSGSGICINHDFKERQESTLKIEAIFDKINNLTDDDIDYAEAFLDFNDHGKFLGYMIKGHHLDGCFVNGVMINSAALNFEKSTCIKHDYDRYSKKVLEKSFSYISDRVRKNEVK